MPMVNVKIMEGVFSPTHKKEMIRKLTDTMVSIEGENMRGVGQRGQGHVLGSGLSSSHEVCRIRSLTCSAELGGRRVCLGLKKGRRWTGRDIAAVARP